MFCGNLFRNCILGHNNDKSEKKRNNVNGTKNKNIIIHDDDDDSENELLWFGSIHGPILGEMTETSVIVWYRDEEGYNENPILIYWDIDDLDETNDETKNEIILGNGNFIRQNDYITKTTISNLKPSTKYKYEIGKKSYNHTFNKQLDGTFTTPGSAQCSFVFGSCVGGQGIGRLRNNNNTKKKKKKKKGKNKKEEDNNNNKMNGKEQTEETEQEEENVTEATDLQLEEGFPIFNAMLECKPDFFHCNGDWIYADNAIIDNNKYYIPDNVDSIPVATTLRCFRERYKYHLSDPILSKFLRYTPVFQTWDDHEIFDDFGQNRLRTTNHGTSLFEAGEQAYFDYWPHDGPMDDPTRIYRKRSWGKHVDMFILDCRQYRDIHKHHIRSKYLKNKNNDNQTPQMEYILGLRQLRWLKKELKLSMATWKFICTSVPISYPTGWPRPEQTGYDGWSDGKNSTSVDGPEIELLDLFEHIRDNNITGILFVSGDVHFPFCIAYQPFLNKNENKKPQPSEQQQQQQQSNELTEQQSEEQEKSQQEEEQSAVLVDQQQSSDQQQQQQQQESPLFYEIGSTPLHALCLPVPDRGPDTSFNPTVLFAKGSNFTTNGENWNFGHVSITNNGQLTFHIRDVYGKSMYELNLEPPQH